MILAALSVSFLINVVLKLHMYGQRTTYAGESWLSTVSSIYVDNWLTEGITNLKFAMIRTFDSIEMRHFGDREVYASFLPGCLFLPYLIAKIFSLKTKTIYGSKIYLWNHRQASFMLNLLLLWDEINPIFEKISFFMHNVYIKLLKYGKKFDTNVKSNARERKLMLISFNQKCL